MKTKKSSLSNEKEEAALINVAPSSTEGHFIKNAKKVVELDKINEIYVVTGPSIMVTKNHTNLERQEDCLITCQRVYDPFKEGMVNARD